MQRTFESPHDASVGRMASRRAPCVPSTGSPCSSSRNHTTPLSVVRTDEKFPVSADESERLKILHELAILDSSPEDVYDNITNLAATMFDIPIALVSLVDTNRQWLKSMYGLCQESRETPRSASFCGYACMPDAADVFVVPNALEDTRFSGNKLVRSSTVF